MQIYNTLTNQKEEFKPVHPGKVMMYVCGPTVYNYIHIGNARSVVAFDTVRRYLEYKGFDVQYVSNFTDVDDKLIKASQETGMTVPELADKYIKAFYEDIDALNVERATLNPRVMENMDEIIASVERCVKKTLPMLLTVMCTLKPASLRLTGDFQANRSTTLNRAQANG